MKDYQIDGVYKIVLELKSNDSNKETRNIIYSATGDGTKNEKPLDNIYDSETKTIKLERTWEENFGTDPAELKAYNDKVMTIYID